MAKNNSGGCKGCPKRYVSHGASQNDCSCHDVCVNPICGDPDVLTLLAPVVYDELGINLCRTISVEPPTGAIASVSAQVLNVAFNGCGPTATSVTRINGRPNCYLVTLTNLAVTFLLTYYDCARRVLGTQTLTTTYLPTNNTVDDYDYLDEDTNPSTVELEIFAPYGLSYSPAGYCDPVVEYVGFLSGNNTMRQGLNMIAIPKILNLDLSNETITIGLTVYIKSVYFSQYLIPHNGKAVVPKASLQPTDDTICMDFVCGDLLDLSIKPLELGPPKCEERLKEACDDQPCDPCCTSTPVTVTPEIPCIPPVNEVKSCDNEATEF